MKNFKKHFFSVKTLSNLVVVGIGILLFILLSNFDTVQAAVSKVFGVFSPFIAAVCIAYLLNIPMMFFERKLYSKWKYRRTLSILTVYALAVAVVVLLMSLVIPQIVDSVINIVSNIPSYLENLNSLAEWLTDTLDLDTEVLDFLVVSYKDLVNEIVTFVRNAIPSVVNWTFRFGSGVITALTALIASIYMLAAKEKLLNQCRKIFYALLSKKNVDGLLRVAGLSNKVFSGFISGKIVDSAIIGVICFVFMWIVNSFFYPMPFGMLISVIIGITNIIPFFGPFIGAIPSIMILLLVNPWSAILFTIFVIVLQQFDGNILGPKILGDSTGLPALWVLIAIIVGGGFFGFPGMVLGVPTVAVLYTLVSDFIASRLVKKNLDEQGNPLPEEEAPPPE